MAAKSFAAHWFVCASCLAIMAWVFPLQAIAQTAPGTNLIVNGDAEAGPGSDMGDTVSSIPGWTTTGNFTVIIYDNQGGFPVATDPGPDARGNNFFAGGIDSTVSTATQTIDLTQSAALIDGGTSFTLSGWLGGYASEDDNAVLQVSFRDVHATELGKVQIGPVLALDRTAVTGLLFRSTSGTVPPGTRQAVVTLTLTRTDGSYDDGYADNLAFSVGPASTQPAITAAGITNAASFISGAGIAPGEIITIFGTGIGPTSLQGLQLTNDKVASTLADVTVLIGGLPAPLIYVASGQLSAIVPYGVAQNASAQISVQYQGQITNTVTVPVVATSPSIFTANSSGSGPAAALNQNGSLNTPSAPALPGDIVTLFATGEGQTSPAGQDGSIAVSPYPKPLLPVSVTIGGQPATVAYYGAAPGEVEGVMQVNLLVPSSVTSGNIPVVLTVGTSSSPANVTIAVR